MGICFACIGQDSVTIKPHLGKSSLKFQYEFNIHDKTRSTSSNIGSLEYGLKLKKCPLIARLNYAAGYGSDALQLEAEAYPSLSKNIYCYINAGYSTGLPLPDYRAGSSVYFALPHAFELEGGIRYLYFNDPIFIFTGSIGKYYRQFWFNVSGYVTPVSNELLKSWVFKTRIYSNDHDYYMLIIGTGVSPDDRSRFVDPLSAASLKSYSFEGHVEKKITKQAVLSFKAGWYKQEYEKSRFLNEFKTGAGLKWLFLASHQKK